MKKVERFDFNPLCVFGYILESQRITRLSKNLSNKDKTITC